MPSTFFNSNFMMDLTLTFSLQDCEAPATSGAVFSFCCLSSWGDTTALLGFSRLLPAFFSSTWDSAAFLLASSPLFVPRGFLASPETGSAPVDGLGYSKTSCYLVSSASTFFSSAGSASLLASTSTSDATTGASAGITGTSATTGASTISISPF